MRNGLPRRIIYTRHPQCLHNVDNDDALRRGIPNRESILTMAGELQRDITAAYLRREFPDIDKVFCSTYLRTHTIPAAAGLEHKMVATPLLDERNMGVWHTHLSSDVLKMHPGEDARYRTTSYYHYEAPNGESCVKVEDRLTELLMSDVLGDPDSTVYISAHGISGLCLRRLVTRSSVEDWHFWLKAKEERLSNASVSVFERQGDAYVCTKYNHVPWEGMIDPALLVKRSAEA